MKVQIGNMSNVYSLVFEGTLRYPCLSYRELTIHCKITKSHETPAERIL